MTHDPFAPKPEQTLECVMTRNEIIARIGLLAETHLLALKNSTAEEVFDSLAGFPVELISHSINGYQRFLTELRDNGGDAGAVVAGMILRFRAVLAYEFGTKVLEILRNEIFTTLTEEQYIEASGKPGTLSMWGVANPTLENTPVINHYDILSTFLFISHAKWLVVRLGAAIEQEKN